MKRTMPILLALAMLTSTAVLAGHDPPTEEQCRTMVDAMLETMRTTPLVTERDKQGAREVIDKAETVVRENRLRGVSECESWAAIGKIVVNQ